MTNALRALGPKTFISYSFKDTELARQLRDHLTDAGFQVTMEDETSLVNTRLPEVLPRRIAEAELFVQLRTANSNKSFWVEQELDLAVKRRELDDGFVLVPVVTDPAGLSDAAREWVYLDASNGFSEALFRTLTQAGLKSIRTIAVEKTNPTMLHDAVLYHAVASADDRRRVLLDPDGHWFDQSDNLIRWADAACIRTFREEGERRRLLPWTFECADVALFCLLRELRARIGLGLLQRSEACAVTQAFYRLVIAKNLSVTLASLADADPLLFESETRDDISDLLEKTKWLGDFEQHVATWALKPVAGIRFKNWHQEFIQTELAGERGKKHHTRVYFPPYAVSAEWGSAPPFPNSPNACVNEYDWALFGLPQVAARAMCIASQYDPRDMRAAFAAIEQGTGWALGDFETLGPP